MTLKHPVFVICRDSTAHYVTQIKYDTFTYLSDSSTASEVRVKVGFISYDRAIEYFIKIGILVRELSRNDVGLSYDDILSRFYIVDLRARIAFSPSDIYTHSYYIPRVPELSLKYQTSKQKTNAPHSISETYIHKDYFLQPLRLESYLFFQVSIGSTSI